MNREKYLEMRNQLVAEAEVLAEEGKEKEFEAKSKEIDEFDASYEKACTLSANARALKEKQPVAAIAMTGSITKTNVAVVDDPFNTTEYRTAFMNYCKSGVMPAEFENSDVYTSTTEAAKMIPTTIVQEVIKALKVYGQIYSQVRQLNIKGGVNFPIDALTPTASWITQATPSSTQKTDFTTSVSFSYYGLECKMAVSLLADVVTLDLFESTVIGMIVEAMIKAIDIAVIKGSGSDEPLGITIDSRVAAGQKITLAAADFVTYDGWKKKVFAKIPLAYRSGGTFIMAAGTFEGYIDGMTDANGQPIGRTNYGITEGPKERFGGRDVMLVEDDVITPYDTASTGDVVAVFVRLKDYGFNSNLKMTMFRYFDHDKNQYVDKAILIADGKLIDANGVLIIKKGA